jgi:isopentenyldiphosphate isomerase
MSDELVDLCDEDNNLTGEKISKNEAHAQGLWHRVAHVWIYNSQGEVMLQLRAKNKANFPAVWDISVAGHVSAGEDPLVSTIREISEEIGLIVKPADLQFVLISKTKKSYSSNLNLHFGYTYFLQYDGAIEDLKLQTEEVEAVKFFTIAEIKKALEENPAEFVPHGDHWLEILAEIEKNK